MSQDERTPDEYARLAALPEDAPERRALADDAQFQARLLLLREFEAGAEVSSGAGDPRRAGAELTRRVLGESAPPQRIPAVARPHRPGWRWALAAAAAVVVASSVLWFRAPGGPGEATRGTSPAERLDWTAFRSSGDGIDLAWTAVPGADRYRVVFYGPAQSEVARIDSLAAPRVRLGRGDLPTGLAPGAEVLAEVSAWRGADVLATSPPRAVRVR